MIGCAKCGAATGGIGPTGMCASCDGRMARDITASYQRADAERVRSVVREACVAILRAVWPPKNEANVSAWSDAIADRVAAAVATAAPVPAFTIPPRKEWDARGWDRGDNVESSDYVDGWNDALDAVEASNGTPIRCDECDPSFTCFDGSAACRKQPTAAPASAPVLSAEEREALSDLRTTLAPAYASCGPALRVIDRLLGGGR